MAVVEVDGLETARAVEANADGRESPGKAERAGVVAGVAFRCSDTDPEPADTVKQDAQS